MGVDPSIEPADTITVALSRIQSMVLNPQAAAVAVHRLAEVAQLLIPLADGAAPLVVAASGGPTVRRLVTSVMAAVEAFRRIERAVGVLMGRHHLDMYTARARLLAATGTLHQSLAQVVGAVLGSTGPPP